MRQVWRDQLPPVPDVQVELGRRRELFHGHVVLKVLNASLVSGGLDLDLGGSVVVVGRDEDTDQGVEDGAGEEGRRTKGGADGKEEPAKRSIGECAKEKGIICIEWFGRNEKPAWID